MSGDPCLWHLFILGQYGSTLSHFVPALIGKEEGKATAPPHSLLLSDTVTLNPQLIHAVHTSLTPDLSVTRVYK